MAIDQLFPVTSLPRDLPHRHTHTHRTEADVVAVPLEDGRRDGDEKRPETQAGGLKTIVWRHLARLALGLDYRSANHNHLIRTNQRRRSNQRREKNTKIL